MAESFDFNKIWGSNSPLPEFTFSDAQYLMGWDFVGSANPTKAQFDAWFRLVDKKLQYLYEHQSHILEQAYPVGRVYISFEATSPAQVLGFGTWEKLQDTFLYGVGPGSAPGDTGGEKEHKLKVNELPKHKPDITIEQAGQHGHAVTVQSGGAHNHTASAGSNGAHTHTGETNNNGAHQHDRGNMNITGKFGVDDRGTWVGLEGAFYNAGAANCGAEGSDSGYVIRFDASRSWTGLTSSNGSHKHTFTTGSNGSHAHNITVNNGGSHGHTVTMNENGQHQHTITVFEVGGNEAHNNLPPYTRVYMWRRTA